jgi:PIN domain nuclease of toxin-antitoxin system
VRFLLDTHAWVWAQLKPELLSTEAVAWIADPGSIPCLSPITFYEVALLAERGRIRTDMPPGDWIRASLRRRPMTILDITADIALEARALPGFANPDPFDRFLLATARVHAIPILTRDESMTRWRGVRVIW